MKSKLNLMTALVGLAMLAMPLTAAARDHSYDNSHAARVARSFSASHYVAPAVVNRHEFNQGARNTWMTGLAPNARRWRRERAYADANAYENYGYGNPGYATPSYVAAPVYAAPAYVAAPYGGYAGGNGCGQARSVVNTYYRDVNTGHRAAANDLLRQNQWAFRGNNGCAAGLPVNGGMLSGLGGLLGGQQAYNNYGPAYNGGGYGYGQPVGSSMLAPLLQYIR